jgi:alkylation response protein AidB-like acyl-CoA dehydrogenase
MMKIDSPGVDVQRIEMLNGLMDFCGEFLTDVRIPDANRIGEVDDGWTVGTRWMFHERTFSTSPYVTTSGGDSIHSVSPAWLLDIARDAGRLGNPRVRDLLGEARTLDLVQDALTGRLAQGIATGRMSDQSAAISRLFTGVNTTRMTTIAFDIAGGLGAAWSGDDGAAAEIGSDFLMRQAATIGGGTTEMARNVISERVLGMPREPSLDRGRPFRDVPRGGRAPAAE